jgi:SAM-dependent methyltransferase
VEEPSGEERPAGWWDLLPFTTHRIELAPGVHTMTAGVDVRDDVRIDLVVAACGGSLAGRTVVDLGCLEGGFTLAFAALGAERAVGIEARELSVRRCELARDLLRLDAAEFVHGDIKEVLAGGRRYDVVFASGILYHLADPAEFLRTMRSACTSVAVIDTHVAREHAASHDCSDLRELVSGGETYRGRMFPEYSRGSSDGEREEFLWAAWSDHDSFWPLEDELVRMIQDAGFSSVERIELTDDDRALRWGVDPRNRVLYRAWV